MIIENKQLEKKINSYDQRILVLFEKIKKFEAAGDEKGLLKLLRKHHTPCIERYELLIKNKPID